MSLTHLPARGTLSDTLISRSLATDAALVIGGTALVALAAQVVVPLWPVPITGQTFAVLLVGCALGARRGVLALGLYLVLGVIGLPVFAGGTAGNLFSMPSGGYLVGFVVAALLVGLLAERGWDRTPLRTVGAFAAGTLTIYAIALPWLSLSLARLGAPHDLGATLSAGLVPFLIGDVLKAVLAAGVLPVAWRLVSRLTRTRDL